MFKLLGNNCYIPTATEVAIGLRSSKLFLPKYHILDGGSICRLIIFFLVITSLLSRVQRYIIFLIPTRYGSKKNMKLICYRTSRSSISIASAYLYTSLSSKNHAIYDPKLRHLHSKTPIVTTPKPHAYEYRTA